MKQVSIDGDIGYDWWTDSGVTAETVQKQLEGLKDGEEINVVINSPGGSVYDGIVIFNILRDCAKSHPVTTQINGIAMSAASYIALAARTVNKDAKILVSDNSIFMIHNPWGYSIGDYRDMKKDADYFDKLAALFSSVYSVASGKSDKEMRDAMDETSFYVGQEILDIGFANHIEKIQPEDEAALANNRDALIAKARFEIERTQAKAQEAKTKNAAAYKSGLEKAVALFSTNVPKPSTAASAKTDGKNNSGGLMTIDELKAQNKELYNEIFAQGQNAERERVVAHLKLAKVSQSYETAVKYIEDGSSITTEAVQAEYLAIRMNAQHTQNRLDDNPGSVNLADNGSDDAQVMAAFEAGYAGKERQKQERK